MLVGGWELVEFILEALGEIGRTGEAHLQGYLEDGAEAVFRHFRGSL